MIIALSCIVIYAIAKLVRKKKKDFGASTGFAPVASAFALQCSSPLSYEDPYNGKQANLLNSTTSERNETQSDHEVNCELRKYKWNEDVIITVAI